MPSPSSLSCLSADGVYEIGGLVPVWAVVVIAGTVVAAVTFFATSNSEPPRFHWVRILSTPRWGRGALESPGGCPVRAPGAARPVITVRDDGSLNSL